jgi:hypothetical protein
MSLCALSECLFLRDTTLRTGLLQKSKVALTDTRNSRDRDRSCRLVNVL